MPTYVYRCKICQITHNHVHGMNENPCPPCPRCGGFSEKVPDRAPAVVNRATPPPAPTRNPEEVHICSNTCVLHRHGGITPKNAPAEN